MWTLLRPRSLYDYSLTNSFPTLGIFILSYSLLSHFCVLGGSLALKSCPLGDHSHPGFFDSSLWRASAVPSVRVQSVSEQVCPAWTTGGSLSYVWGSPEVLFSKLLRCTWENPLQTRKVYLSPHALLPASVLPPWALGVSPWDCGWVTADSLGAEDTYLSFQHGYAYATISSLRDHFTFPYFSLWWVFPSSIRPKMNTAMGLFVFNTGL